MYCKGLTKQELLDLGIIDVKADLEGGWSILRYWYKNNTGIKEYKTISVTLACGKHKYRPNKYYPKVTFCAKQKVYNIPLSRLVYVWHKGDIPDGYVVDHIDNDSFNNNIDNLQILTVEENLAKRYEDNPEAWTNQWGHTKEFNK